MSVELSHTQRGSGGVSTLFKTIRSALIELLQWPWLAWLQPKATVRVLQPDGSANLMQGGHRIAAADASTDARFVAVVLAPDDCLMRTLNLPDMPHEDIERALELEVASHSPFAERDTVWGWRIDRRAEVISATVAITSRALAESMLLRRDLLQSPLPEVWADSDPPLVISGFGETRREAVERRMTITVLAASAVLAGALLVLAATPFLQLRLQVFDAVEQLSNLHETAIEVVAQREALVRARMRADAIEAAIGGRSDPLDVLETLAVLLPDSGHLISLDVAGDRVRMTGISTNASALIEHIGSDPRIRGLRPTGAISRVGPEGEENFSVEFTYRSSVGGAS